MLNEVVLVGFEIFYIIVNFNLELLKGCRDKYGVILNLYKFIHTVIKYACSLNVKRFVSLFSFHFSNEVHHKKGGNLDFDLHKEYLELLHFFIVLSIHKQILKRYLQKTRIKCILCIALTL